MNIEHAFLNVYKHTAPCRLSLTLSLLLLLIAVHPALRGNCSSVTPRLEMGRSRFEPITIDRFD